MAGKTGALTFDSRGDRIAEYSVKHYQYDKWEEIATIDSDGAQAYKLNSQLSWNGQEGFIPPDTPECGFDGTSCTGELLIENLNYF